MVGVEVVADDREDTRRADAAVADLLDFSFHLVHIGGRTAEIADVSAKVLHLGDGIDFFKDRFFRAAGDKLALVGRYGAKATATEASTVHIDGKLDHLVGRDRPAFGVFGVRESGIRQIERGIDLFFGHGLKGWVDHHRRLTAILCQTSSKLFIGFLLDVFKVTGVHFFVVEAIFVACEGEALPLFVFGEGFLARLSESGLGDGFEAFKGDAFLEEADDLAEGLFAHAVDKEVGVAVDQDGGFDLIGPIVVVSDAPKGGFDPADQYGCFGVELFEDAGVGGGCVVRAKARFTAWCVGVVGAKAFACGVFVDHGVHAASGDTEEKARWAKLFEVAQIVFPVGLADESDTQAHTFDEATDHSGAKRGVIDIGITRNQDHIEFIPAAKLGLFGGGGKPVG